MHKNHCSVCNGKIYLTDKTVAVTYSANPVDNGKGQYCFDVGDVVLNMNFELYHESCILPYILRAKMNTSLSDLPEEVRRVIQHNSKSSLGGVQTKVDFDVGELIEKMKEIGEEATKKDIYDFIRLNPSISSVENFFDTWFEQRNKQTI